jgi:flagellar hook assembly protein FlgD
MKKYIIIAFILTNILFASSTNASLIEGTTSHDGYLIILVHGINGNAGGWAGYDHYADINCDINDINNYNKYGGFKKYLEKPISEGGLGLKGYVYAYTFSAPCGSAVNNARELGDRNYPNPAPEMNSLCWLEKAKVDYKNNFIKIYGREPNANEIPNKYIIFAHSMGNYAPRGYIYSGQLKQMYSEGFYKKDVDKIIFVDAALKGSTSTYVPYLTWYGITSNVSDRLNDYMTGRTKSLAESAVDQIKNEIGKYIQDQLLGGDIFGPYQLGADLSGSLILIPRAYYAMFGIAAPNPAWGGLPDTLPLGNTVRILGNVKPLNPWEEPSYSIIYGTGIPVFEPCGTGIVEVLNLVSEKRIISNNILEQYLDLNYQKRTLFNPLFYSLPTSQSKYLSLQFARFMGGFYTNDGDMVIDVSSQKGEGLSFLGDAPRYNKIFKSEGFENYLNSQFVAEVAATEACIAAAAALVAMGGTPYPIAWQSFWWMRFIPALSLVNNVNGYKDEINYSINAHGNILKENELMARALLDSPSIATILSMQATWEPTASTSEGKSFTASASVPSGFQTLNVKSITEKRNTSSLFNMPIPMTLDGQRMYVENMTITKPPKRVCGKLNYLVPSLMRKFEYSFNFAAWQPITGVDPDSGEFVLEDLPFAEGQNVLAIRAENAVGIKSHQLLTIILNTIPLLPSEFAPAPNSYTNNNQPTFRVKFAKSAYSSSPLEHINISTAKLIKPNGDEIDISGDLRSITGGETYDRNIAVEYTPTTPLDDGEYKIVVVANSNVGVSQALWTVTIDTRAPSIAMEPLRPYSPRAPTTIRYSVSDEAASALRSVRCDLYNQAGNFITQISTDEALAGGEHYFNWDGTDSTDLTVITDGTYKVRIKAFDLAGNYAVAEAPMVIDSTPPSVLSANVTPNPLSSKSNELKLNTVVSEKSQVFIRMANLSKGSVKGYLTNAEKNIEGSEARAGTYTWTYNNTFLSGPEDGIYNVELSAQDEAGNLSAPLTLEAIRIDRTPPVVYAQATLPYVLSNSGSNPYTTTLSYKLSESNDAQELKGRGVNIKVKLYNETTHDLAYTWDSAPDSMNETNQISWNGNSPEFTKGSYRFQIIAEDELGNQSIAYANCVKDGIAPVISFPAENGTEIGGVIAIRGTAIDPDWTNSKPFKQYRVYYASGRAAMPGNLETLGSEWLTEAVEVPLSNRDANSGTRYAGQRPLQNDSTLAYLYSNMMANGEYTILVVADELGGESIATARIVEVENEGATSSIPSPYVKLYPVASEINFKMDGSVKLPINFLNSVKPANVHLEVGRSGGPVVMYKYFPNLAGAPYIGRPDYRAGADLGYFIWEDEQVWHIRWSSDGTSHHFTGNLIALGGSLSGVQDRGAGIKVISNIINWDSSASAGEAGFDFKVENGKQLMISPKIDEDPTSPSPYASNIYLGISKATQEFVPIMVDLQNRKLMDLAAMGSASGGSDTQNVGRSASSGIEWDGKLDTGAFVDDGNYVIRVRAEGVDGFGIATDEAQVKVVTPFELKNVEAVNKSFSPLSAPDRISVFYNLSKDALVSAYVYDESGGLKAILKEGEKVLGALNPNNRYSLSWRGNYPTPDSGTVVTYGRYYLKLIARALDGSGEQSEEIRDVSIVETRSDANYARLEAMGEEKSLNGDRIRLAEGESPYYFEAKASGVYYPPKDFNYTLSASGKQRFTTYPYVPFAALVHRGFNTIKLKVKPRLVGNYADFYYRIDLSGAYWRRDGGYDFVRERPAISPDLTIGNESATLSDAGNCDDLFGRATGIGQPGKEFNYSNITVDICAQDDETLILDTVTIPDSQLWNVSSVQEIPGEKGAFVLAVYPGETARDNRNYRLKLHVKPASEIAYSRLTNRFVPWVDFVCAKRPVSKDDNFANYMNRLDKLGFPGKSYFMGTTATVPTAPHRSAYDTSLFAASLAGFSTTVTSGGLTFSKPKAAEILDKTKTGFSETVETGYSSYLSGEYLEFIPITAPEKGHFEFSNGAQINLKVYFQGNKDPSTLNVRAVTPVKMEWAPEAGDSRTPFVFDWPHPNFASFNAKYGVGGEYYKKLIKKEGGDPQNWNGYGSIGATENVCYYELEQAEIDAHGRDKYSESRSAGVVYYKDKGKSEWTSGPLYSILDPPNYIEGLKYDISGTSNGVKPQLQGMDRNGYIYAYDTLNPVPWTSSDDATLYANSGLIKSGLKLFNMEDFRGLRNIAIFPDAPYRISEDVSSQNALKYTFIKSDVYGRTSDSPADNPNLVIRNWGVVVKDRNDQINEDLEIGEVKVNGDHKTDHFELKLKTSAPEKRYVEIRGASKGPYELMYFDGDAWKTITSSYVPKSGRLAWWNVNRLNGRYTVLLKSREYVATQDIHIGTLIKDDGKEKDVFSAYRRAQLKFPAKAFGADQIATVTPVTMTEIKIRNRPIIMTHGPIVEIKPSPFKFKTPQEDGVDLRPTLKFYYTFDDLINLGLNPDKDDPTKNLGLNIHQITAAGDLQVIDNNEQTYDPDNKLYCFSGPVNHFSTYTLTKGKIKLSAPMVFADRYITNKDTVTIYGTAEVDTNLDIYIQTEPASEPRGSAVVKGEPDTDGRFLFENIKLLQEGNNYIYVLSYPRGNPEVKTVGEILVVKDITPPVARAYANLKAFSPNNDGKWDVVEYDMASNEKGKLGFIVTAPDGKMLVNQELATEAEKAAKLVWGQYGFNIYQRLATGDWGLMNTINASSVFADGYYNYTVYAIDEAGNISNNIGGTTVIDTAPPKVLALSAAPNPFTPNEDGIKDTTSISYSLSEPSYVTTKINREDGALFRKYSQTVGDFNYPAFAAATAGKPANGSWSWEGKGSRNELLGGTYTYFIEAEDPVGNFASSEVKTVIVDRAPSLIPYAYAEPDPFSPVNPKNNYTEVKYYLSRDNLQVQASVIGREGKPLKNLVFGETQGKGEHSARWYGDFIPGYDGPKASADSNRVGDGSYEFKVIAVDPDLSAVASAKAEVSNTVLVDNVAPYITLQPVAVDYANKKATLTYSIPETSSVEVSVYDLSGYLVDALDSGTKKAGSYSLTYMEPATKRRGSNYFKIIAVDSAKNEDERTTEIFSVVPIGDLRLANVSAAPNPFTPNGDVIKDQIRISYGIDGGVPEYRASLYILDPSGATVKKVVEDEPQYPGTYSFYWTGKVDNPDPSSISYAKDGNYTYKVIVKDKLGHLVETEGDIILVSSKPVVAVSVDPVLISPNGDGLLDTTLINYSIDYPVAQIASPAQVRLDIVNNGGETIFTKSFSHTPGNYTFIWDGKDKDQLTVNSGQYAVYIYATDALGTPAVPKSTILNVDITNPSVDISTDSGLIANPGAFSTNANPDGTDIPRQTTLYYKLAEESYITMKVYKLRDDQIAFSAADFNDGNYIQTLLTGDWKEGNTQYAVQWDGRISDSANQALYDVNNDGYADPGKYAFIVEGKDRAENLTLKKWGGTVWIQNNVLTLRDTDQRGASNNPDPKIISPYGNSTALEQKRARLYFYIDLSLNPASGVVKSPERIEALAVEAETKSIGKYSVKVFSDAALTSLVRTITSEANAQSATNTWEDWDGKNDLGAFAAEGIYYMAVDVKDYAGNPANQNLLTRQVIVDNTPPNLSGLSLNHEFISPNSSQSTAIKDVTFNYQLSDNLSLLTSEANKINVTAEILKGIIPVRDLLRNATIEVTDVLAPQAAINWAGDLPGGSSYVGSANGGGVYSDGEYICKLTVVDRAGNIASETRTFMVDTVKPTGSIVIRRADRTSSDFTNSENVNLSLSYNDSFGSGVEKMRFSIDRISWTDWEDVFMEKDYTLAPLGEGLKYVYVSYLDKVGNYSDFDIVDTITVDQTNPTIVNAPTADPISTVRASTNLAMTLSDNISGVARWDLVVNNFAGQSVYSQSGTGDNFNVAWDGAGQGDGYYYYYVVVTDGAGNVMRSYENGYGSYRPYGNENSYYRLLIDRTPPTASISSPANNGWVKGSIDIVGTAYDDRPGNYKVEYHNGTEWVRLSESIYPEEAILDGNTASIPPILECEAKVSIEASSLYLGDIFVEESVPDLYPPVFREFDVTEAGEYIFETYGEGNGYGFLWNSTHYLQNLSGGDLIPPISRLDQQQPVMLGPGRYHVAVGMQIQPFTDRQIKRAGSRIRKAAPLTNENFDEKQFTLDKKQKIMFEPYYSGTGTYGSEHWLFDSLGSQIVYASSGGGGYDQYPVLDPGTYRIKVRGWTSGGGSSINAGTKVYTNYGEWTETKAFTIQYGQDILIEAVPNYNSGGESEHWLFDSGGNQLFYSNLAKAETKYLSAGNYTLKTKGRASFGWNYSKTRASPKKNNIQNGKLASWNTLGLSENDYSLKLTVLDEVGNPSEHQILARVDNTKPSISISGPSSFNPYVDGPINISFTPNDNRSDQIFVSYCGICTTTGTEIFRFTDAQGWKTSGNAVQINWDGRNSAGDYVNEGAYQLLINIYDRAYNILWYNEGGTHNFSLQDDQRISNSSADSTNPYLTISASNLDLKWIEGWQNPDESRPKTAETGWAGGDQDENAWFYVNFDGSPATLRGDAEGEDGRVHKIFLVSSDGDTGGTELKAWYDDNPQSITLNKGWYRLYVWVSESDWWPFDARGSTSADYKYRWFNKYTKTSSDLGKNWGTSNYNLSDSCDNGPSYIFEPQPTLIIEGIPPLPVFVYSSGTKVYDIYGSGNNLYYRKGTLGAEYRSSLFPASPSSIPADKISWSYSAQITHTGSANRLSVSMCKDGTENIYVAWQQIADDNREIFFQKIPSNFAPVNGTVTAAMVKVPEAQQVTTQQPTPEAPTLLEPGDVSGKEINTSRPTFKWKAPKDIYTEYRVQWSQVANAEGDGKTTKMNTSGSEKPSEAGTLYFAHQLDSVFDPALERNKTYYWKVAGKKVDGTEIQSNDIFSFTCNPPFEISGITNYPNPFDPNKDLKTTIRYKLSKDADEVMIRIYDITGALVTELDGTTNGEGQDRWVNKYNDVKWDGRNGRGDLVLNGIYPFEVVARAGGTSVSGRGKIAVLK